jgi:Major Facilitator Superfamily.
MAPSGLRAVLLLGLVSMLGDFIYEGGRSVLPDYMRQLGMSAALVGTLLGLSELAGWLARPLGGVIADRTGRYSGVMRLGYGGLVVVPLIGLTSNWLAVSALVFAERVVRGLRIPPRDAMLSRLRREVGLGMAFGIHELLDQVGATAGPLAALLLIALLQQETRQVFLWMLVPYLLLLLVLARVPEHRERVQREAQAEPPRRLLLYSAAAGLNVGGLLPLPVLLFLVSEAAGAGSWLVPAAYMVAMVVDAAVALPLGRAFDRLGPRILHAVVVLSVAPSLLLWRSVESLLLAALLVGVVMGAQESIFRAMVAQLAGGRSLGVSYATYGLFFGAGSALSGLAFGLMADLNLGIPYYASYSAAMQAASLAMLLKLAK